jgi:hypothetical protein
MALIIQTRRYLLGKLNLIKIQDKSFLQNRTLYLTKNNNKNILFSSINLLKPKNLKVG